MRFCGGRGGSRKEMERSGGKQGGEGDFWYENPRSEKTSEVDSGCADLRAGMIDR